MAGDVPPLDLYGSGYEAPLSLWKLVEQHVPEHEREEVRNLLGESLIDQSLELHEEVDTLLEIWRDYREETDLEIAQPTRLPEPPELRERLVQEISFFTTSIKEKAKNQGIDPEKLLSSHNSEIIEYAQEISLPSTERSFSRLQTSRSKDGFETPRVGTPDRLSTNSSISESVESMSDKLNMLHFDEVLQHLRSTLQEEVNLLLEDINFLQQCLDDEASFRAGGGLTLTREPTLTELKEERSSLEKELLSGEPVPVKPPGKRPMFTPSRLRNIPPKPSFGSQLRPPSHSTSASSSSSQRSPLKASHELRPTVPTLPPADKTTSLLYSPSRYERKEQNSPTGSISSTTSKVSLQDIGLFDRQPANRKRTLSPGKIKVVPVDSIIDSGRRESDCNSMLTRSPPSTGRRTDRLSSADRFRSMVLKNREQPA
ncbi:coiled-coil domain-containing protein 24-like [Gigantopelta aegis]|uniref:coiled-coil domain-containing protein 24-like n=1 Tax=Gigantopelta aegis TaxID=1735272 RepID=UPI001B88C3A6|nr:coiled-coil domain-containing protein 24-like [Gigantopelta aegis]XP_041359161.1 coiled-coil domain-containing protein 24-like [Gigantopelta aegis]